MDSVRFLVCLSIAIALILNTSPSPISATKPQEKPGRVVDWVGKWVKNPDKGIDSAGTVLFDKCLKISRQNHTDSTFNTRPRASTRLDWNFRRRHYVHEIFNSHIYLLIGLAPL